MFTFTSNGYVNLDRVARVVEKGDDDVRFLDAKNRLVGFVDLRRDLEEMTAPCVPAAPGATAVFLWNENPNDQRPTEADIGFQIMPIVAWRIRSEKAVPVFFESGWNSAMYVLPLPDGRFCEPDTATYEDLDSAKSEALEREQKRWDRIHLGSAKIAGTVSETNR
jgi:hypothetical protein